MKKVIIAIIAFAVLATGVIFAMAQRSGDGQNGGWGKRGGHHRGEMMLRGLDLTDEQKVQVKQIVEASKTKTQPIRESLKANHQKLDELTANGAFDETAVSAIATEKGNISAQMTVERARVTSQIFALLTDDQKVKAAEMKSKMQERFKGKMKDRESDGDAPVGSEL
jgi:Spy/CpxP family protein refolding chaperone